MINGAPKRNRAFARLMGYVEQFDAHNPQVRAGRMAWADRPCWPVLHTLQAHKHIHTANPRPPPQRPPWRRRCCLYRPYPLLHPPQPR